MRRRSLVAFLALSLSLAAGRAEAVTIRDVIELSKAGLSDSILLALIDVDRSVFAIDASTLKQLKSAGVSDDVIVAMVRSGREPRVEAAAPPAVQQQEPVPMPPPEDSGQSAVAPAPPYPVAVPVPVFVAVPVAKMRRPPMNPVVAQPPVALPPNCVAAQVPNWGFGGTIRQLPPPCR